TFAPGAAECVANENRNRQPSALFYLAIKFASGSIGIGGKKQRVPTAVDIRNVDTAVGADKALRCLGNKHAILASNHAATFAQCQLDDAGIEIVFSCPRKGRGGGFDRVEIDYAAFHFG